MQTDQSVPAVVLSIRGLGRGGAERLVVQEALHLSAAGFHVEIWYQVGGEFVPELADVALPAHRVGIRDARRRMISLLANHPSLVVHTHSPSMGGMLRIAATGLRGARFIHTEHNLVSSYRSVTTVLHRRTARRIDELVAVSHAVLAESPSVERSRVIYHADLETERMRSCLATPYREGGEARIVCIASLTPKKDHANLLRALEALDAHLDRPLSVGIVGDGPLRSEIEASAEAVTQRCPMVSVELMGVRDDVADVLRDADVLVLPSLSEGLPLTIMEAMAASTPVVATAVGGVPELIVDRETGLLVPPADAAALQQAISTLLGDDVLRQSLARDGREAVLRLVGQAWPHVYESMIRDLANRP